MEPISMGDHFVSHIMEDEYGVARFVDSVTIVNKGQQIKLVKILIAFTSLDFSSNNFEGPILEELMNLKALHALNLSHSSFSGHIPSTLGTQIQSFEADSFMGNEGLCGPPLTQDCGGGGGQGPSSPQPSSKRSSIDWSLFGVELGFTFGFGIIIMPVCKRWRLWYSKKVDDVLYKIVPQLDFVYESRGGKTYRSLKWKPY
ncbi:hypothetical protein PIB30_064094 [Stylosanthes scabra]|uniref:Uncharacterized protein n=1 Tax=Stylosanthes scabra TaxID=79078 RepID=A0ABU6YJ43_9FABA|nr:hypothetical protein [Stylosanthes scabra]